MNTQSALRKTPGYKTIIALFVVAGVLFSQGFKAQAASGNDNFASAQVISGTSGAVSGSNVGNTTESGEPNSGDASAWYSWTAPASGTATFNTFGSSFDTILSAYTGGSVSILTQVASNDDTGGVQSQIQFNAVAGTTYMIAVDGFNGNQGSISLNYSLVVPELAGLFLQANPSNSGTLSGSGTYVVGTFQQISATATTGWVFSNWNDGNTQSTRSVSVPSGGVTYTANFQPTAALNVQASPSIGGTVSGSGTFVVASSQQITATANSGWFFVAWNDGNTQNPRSVTIPSNGATYTATFQVISNDNNDGFSNALVLSGSNGYVIDTNAGYTKQTGEPNHAGNSGGTSAWYSWTAPFSGWMTFDTNRSSFDTLLAIYTGTNVSGLTQVASNDDASTTGRPSLVAVNVVAGTTYNIAVDGFNGASGTIFLTYQPAVLVPVNVQANPVAGGTVLGSGTYAVGASVQISGSVNPTYIFTGWEDGDARISRSITVPAGGATYTANFLKTTGSNDSFAGLQVLSGSFGVLSGTTTGFTKEVNEPNHAGNQGGASAWYSWTAPVSGPVTFDTIGSSFDTLLAVYTGTSVSNLSSVASNNDADGTTRQSRVTFSAVAGTNYKIAVDGYNGQTGSLTLNFQQLQAILTVVASPVAGGTVTGSGTFAAGYSTQITATVKPGYLFNGWNDGNTQTARSVTVPVGGITYTANFVVSGTIAVVANPSTSGTVFGGGVFGVGSTQKIGINPKAGWLFTSWNDGNTLNPRTVTTGSGNVTYTGTLVAASTLNIQSNPAEGGTVIGSGTYVIGSSQQISATANSGWLFTGWNDGSTQNPRTVSVPSAGASYTASFGRLISDNNDNFASALVLNSYSGTITDSNIGFSKEVGEPNHAAVSGSTSAWYSWTAVYDGWVTFNTVGSSFDTTLAAYTGTSVSSLTQIAANDDLDVNTRQSQIGFSAVAGTTYRIAVDAFNGGSGIIVLNYSQSAGLSLLANPSNGGTLAGSGTFAIGATPQISASANSGWIFTGWSDGNTNNPRTITLAGGGSTYTANFSQIANVSVVASPSTSGSVSGTGTYIVGSSQQISATANAGWAFSSWSDGNTDNPRSIIVPLGGASYTANFSSTVATLSGTANPLIAGIVSGTGTYLIGSSQQISATANAGWLFTGWSDGNTNNPRTVILPQNGAAFTANFAAANSLTVLSNPIAGGTATGGGTYVIGSSHTISATANSGWIFTGWNDGNTTNPRTVIVPDNGAVYTASFSRTAALTLAATPAIAGTVAGSGTFVVGSSHNITATPAIGWKFVKWIGSAGTSTENPLSVTIQPNGTNCTAQFAPANPDWKGAYYGIFDGSTSGALVVKINPLGSFTASLNIGGNLYSAHSAFDENGTSSLVFPRSPFILNLTMGATKGEIQGSLYLNSNPSPLASFDLIRSMIDSNGDPSLYQDNYTFILQADAKNAAAPKGNGFGTFSVNKTGGIRINGKLADGTAFTQSTALTKNATLPVYAAIKKLPTPTWFVVGLLTFEDLKASDIDGTLRWSKPVRPTDALYPAGFNTSLTLLGSRYLPDTAFSVQFFNGSVSAKYGNLGSLFDGNLSLILAANKLGTGNGLNSLTLKFDAHTGLLSGQLSRSLGGTKPVVTPIQGVILQKTLTGAGYFIDDFSQSGPFSLTAPSVP